MRTARNIFGLVRQYLTNSLPSHDPEELVTLEDLSTPTNVTQSNPFYPYPNSSSHQLGSWHWSDGTQKSQQGFKNLVNIITSDDFVPKDLVGTNWRAVDKVLGDNVHHEPGKQDEAEWMQEDAGWAATPIKVTLPSARNMAQSHSAEYVGGDLHHRSLTQVIRERLTDPNTSRYFHFEPYELRWQRNEHYPEFKLHGEMYTSDAFLQAHKDLQQSSPEPNCKLERVVASLMFWSDSMHLTSFGDSHLWPCYLYFGNESKYNRCKPSAHLCSHVAYFRKLSGDLKSFATGHVGGKGPNKVFLAHCRREFFHQHQHSNIQASHSCTTPGELQHRNPKAWYPRTDHKSFERQITRIERRLTRIHCIKQNICAPKMECNAISPDAHHKIGQSESEWSHIGTFLQDGSGDPALKDFLPKLKEHLLDRVIQMIETDPSNVGATPAFELGSKPDAKHLFFKSDRLYRHNLLQVNYTTYDVRRKRDSINPRTSHRDVMVLSGEENSSAHPYLYARVIRIFHANVIYTGPGTTGYRPR
ncbi:hypothetical protein FIBSPDRAFT_965136 [Athelia psychrophila]|uniref:Uncharacterized protein n=1 Tax=Athelia psychrophila TaxID=1759441 RepID=A0A165WZR0_9AGAM|nr:hypothetical protein FIBSPDRAFT_965136 [Fibularhizoctonia sp. CBS 109695]